MCRRILATLGAALLASGIAARTVQAHPLHSTITELTEDRAHGIVRATIRVFADDFGTAVARATKKHLPTSPGAEWDATALAYVATSFNFTDQGGRALPVRSCGTKRTADLLWICVEASTPDGLAALKVRNGVLSDLFDDQVNVVQGSIAGARRSVLFIKGDRAKPLT